MITETRVITSLDVFVENDGIVLPPLSVQSARLAALTYVVSARANLQQARLDGLALGARSVSKVFPLSRLWLLATQSAWQPDTKRMHALKLWRWLASGGLDKPKAQGVEVVRVSSLGIRWFSVAEIDESELSVAQAIVSAEQASFIVASPDPPEVETYLAAGWAEGHPGSMAFWRDMALVKSREGCVVFRLFGKFDDIEAGVNMLGDPKTIAVLEMDGSLL